MGSLALFKNIDHESVVEVASEIDSIFAPVPHDEIESLINQHRIELEGIKVVASVMNSRQAASASYFFVKASLVGDKNSSFRLPSFDYDSAVAALDSHFWDKALRLTGVFDLMPQARRTEWTNTIRDCKTPPFVDVAVRSTLKDMVCNGFKFFAERVDGVFSSLSRSHITNRPEGFSSRLILNAVFCDGSLNSEKSGYINDLRCVIARLMGRAETKCGMSHSLFSVMSKSYGEWMPVDAGVLRMKLFKNGNVHIEIGPDMAWRLNVVLASLYPLAIPSQFRVKPKAAPKEFKVLGKPVAFEVLRLIYEMRNQSAFEDRPFTQNQNSYVLQNGSSVDEQLRKQVARVISFLGGVECRINSFRWYEFDYNPQSAFDYLVTTGCIPDHVSHQYFPTREKLASYAVEQADIQPTDTILEPEAGQGGIAEFLPADRTTCVEISDLHCKILAAKGYKVVCADYLKWAQTAPKFDKVISNPPFSDGRAVLHMKASAQLVKNGGRLVGILPCSLRGKDLLGPGWDVVWSKPFSDEFDGTGVTVVIMTAQKL